MEFSRFFSIIFVLAVFLSVFLSNSAFAQESECLEVKLARSTYFSGEVFQAEISGNFIKALTSDNINFYLGDQKYYPIFNLKQLSSNKWILFFNVPKKYGDNYFEVSKVLCKDPLREESKKISFIIKKPFDEIYSEISEEVYGKWNKLDDEEKALALMDFYYNEDLKKEGEKALLLSSYEERCWPSDLCKTKETALAYLALKSINSSKTEKVLDWLKDSENNVELGLWSLVLSSTKDQFCELLINNISTTLNVNSGTNAISINFPEDSQKDDQILLSLNCSLENAKLSHIYKGIIHDFPLIFNESWKINLNNQKCWGENYKSKCDATSTSYAIWALQSEKNLENEKEWLSSHASSTEEKAFSYYFGNYALESYLVNNQHQDGYWTSSSLAISSSPDIKATVSALRSMTSEVKQKGEKWLFNQLQSNNLSIKEQLYILQIFPTSKLLPLLSFSEGLFKAPERSNITLSLANRGITEIYAEISGGIKKIETLISPGEIKKVVIELPEANEISFSNLNVLYKNNFSTYFSYDIPFIIYPKAYSPEQLEEKLNIKPESSIISENIVFIERSINETFSSLGKKEISFTIKNEGTLPRNITLTASGIYSILDSIIPSDFVLNPEESKEIKLVIDPSKGIGAYEGKINAETLGFSTSIPIFVNLNIQEEISQVSEEIPKEKVEEKSSTKIIGWIMIISAFLIAAIFLYFKLRKKKTSPLMEQLKKIKSEQITPFSEVKQ